MSQGNPFVHIMAAIGDDEPGRGVNNREIALGAFYVTGKNTFQDRRITFDLAANQIVERAFLNA